MADLLLTGIGELVTNRPGSPDLVGSVPAAAVAIRDGRVAWAGPRSSMPEALLDLPPLDCEGRAVLPGFVDGHTHLVFAGDRAGEFARRLRGESYESILAGGGGIRSTVTATRAASVDELVDAAGVRLAAMLATGTTTAEVKSGYGLNTESERTMLEAVARLDELQPIDLVPTFLGGHVVPEEFRDERDGYVDLVVDEMLPACAPLARSCDVFCDEAAFTVDEARRMLEAGIAHGLRPRLHAEQLAHTGGATLAAELEAASADHLDHATADDLAALRQAGTVAILLPGVSLSMRLPFPDGRRFWDAGLSVAIATDCNPGTSFIESMPLMVALACLEMGFTPEQATWSATRGGALALDLPDRGVVAPGALADLVVLDAPSYVHLAYRPGAGLIHQVIKAGSVVGAPG